MRSCADLQQREDPRLLKPTGAIFSRLLCQLGQGKKTLFALPDGTGRAGFHVGIGQLRKRIGSGYLSINIDLVLPDLKRGGKSAMKVEDVSMLRRDLETSKLLLLRMNVREQVLKIAGRNALVEWEEYEAGVAALGRLELGLTQAAALAKVVAVDLQDKLKSFADKSPLALQAAEIAVSVQVAAARRVDGQVVVLARKTATIFGYFAGGGLVKKLLSKKTDLPVLQMLIDIDRLLPLVDALKAAAENNSAETSRTAEPASENRI